MLAVARRKPTDEDILDWLATLDGFIEGLTLHDGEPTQLYDYQKRIIADEHPFIKVEKARQTGWSFARAARALAQAHLRDNWLHIFVSLNLEEAKEKIRYANLLWETLPAPIRLRKKIDNKLELEFENGSRLICMFQPRGKGPADIDIDEHAHFGEERAKAVYVAALPIISRGGQLSTGSTPLGQAGQFYDIVHETEGKYRNFHHYRIYWWDCPDLCTDVKRARKEAAKMTTAERVERFGTEQLKAILDNMPVEDFQQEYELEYIDETTAYFPYELILRCTEPAPEVYDSFRALAEATRGVLYAGFDVGRRRNTSELTILEKLGDRFYERLFKTYDKVTFEAQQADLEECLDALPMLTRLCIDETGIGMNLAENLAMKYGSRVEPVTLTNEVKERIAVEFKIALEKQNLRLYPDKDRIRQIHSVKRLVTPGGSIRFDTARNEKHHADKFWSQALALWAGVDSTGRVELSHLGTTGITRESVEVDW